MAVILGACISIMLVYFLVEIDVNKECSSETGEENVNYTSTQYQDFLTTTLSIENTTGFNTSGIITRPHVNGTMSTVGWLKKIELCLHKSRRLRYIVCSL